MTGALPNSIMVPPKSEWSEQAVLAAFLTEPKTHWRIQKLTADHFFLSDNRRVFEVIRQAEAKGEDFDIVTVGEAVEDLQLVAEIASASGSTANIDSYIGNLHDAYQRRKLIKHCMETVEGAYQQKAQARGLIDALVTKIDGLSMGARGEASTFAETLEAAALECEESSRMTDAGSVAGIPTRIPFIDSRLGGMRRKRLYVLAARPSWGKTALMLQMCLAGAKSGHAAAIMSLEMTRQELGQRAICNLDSLDFHRVQSGRAVHDFRQACRRYQDLPLMIDDETTHIADIVSRAHELKHRHNIAVLAIDYIGLIQGGEGQKARERLAEYSGRLKRLAKELDICVILLAQLNRDCEKEKRRPHMPDIRECGDIEQDADVIIALNPKSPFYEGSRTMEVGYLKSRLSQAGWCQSEFSFNGRYQQFKEFANYEADA